MELGKKCRDRGEHSYNYKNLVKIIPLSMIDDLLSITKCGQDSLAANVFIGSQIECFYLRLSVPHLA